VVDEQTQRDLRKCQEIIEQRLYEVECELDLGSTTHYVSTHTFLKSILSSIQGKLVREDAPTP
jgi:hypothetical protein